ncbi:MAG: hypothetical protein Q9160_006321 [Pyrenula sp. 1 TL-2023]
MESGPSDFSIVPDLSCVSGRTILITGGASGFGEAMAKRWSSAPGVKPIIILGDIIPAAKGTTIAESIQKETGNPNVYFVQVDVTSWESQVSLFRRANTLAGSAGIDTVAASAGVNGSDESLKFMAPPPMSGLDKAQEGSDQTVPSAPSLNTLNVNLIGTMYTVHLALSYFSARHEAESGSTKQSHPDTSILLFGSLASILPLPMQSIYGTSKHALVGLFRSLRVTLPSTHPNVRLNILCPYFVRTPMVGNDGSLLLAGGALAEINDVINAATWCVGRSDMRGRALAIGPQVTKAEGQSLGLPVSNATDSASKPTKGNLKAGESQSTVAIWDCFAHDHELSDIFGRRIMALAEMKTAQRGWRGIGEDLYNVFSSILRGSTNRVLGRI